MSPKQQFLEQHKDDVKFLADLTASPRFQRCANYALLQYVQNTSRPLAEGNAARILGAQEFLHVLETLWVQSKESTKTTPDNLNHRS